MSRKLTRLEFTDYELSRLFDALCFADGERDDSLYKPLIAMIEEAMCPIEAMEE